ncbi:MAG TPA: lysylphosphatidylglycerol synthase domain-containing protein [Bacteroidia bacterium]|jgi:hypothetical protein
MNKLNNKRFYKVISLFIKSLILILSFYYIYQKIVTAPLAMDAFSFNLENAFYILLIFLLMLANWSLEALKWKLLVAPLELISFFASLKAVFAGVTVSILTPNRVGEFAARVFFLEKADKIKASVASLAGSLMQLAVTIAAGMLAYYTLQVKYYDFFQTEQFISTNALLLILLIAIALIASVGFIWLKKSTTFIRYKKNLEVFSLYSKRDWNQVFLLSLIRYMVFSLQYYLVLRLFGINAGPVILFSLIALTFFATSAIPTFALTEIAVRAGTAVYFFSTINSDLSAIIASSLFLWIINIALPALMGSAFVWKLKFFKES